LNAWSWALGIQAHSRRIDTPLDPAWMRRYRADLDGLREIRLN